MRVYLSHSFSGTSRRARWMFFAETIDSTVLIA